MPTDYKTIHNCVQNWESYKSINIYIKTPTDTLLLYFKIKIFIFFKNKLVITDHYNYYYFPPEL